MSLLGLKPTSFVDIDYLLNYIGLKLLQQPQDWVHFHHSLFCPFIATKEIHGLRSLQF